MVNISESGWRGSGTKAIRTRICTDSQQVSLGRRLRLLGWGRVGISVNPWLALALAFRPVGQRGQMIADFGGLLLLFAGLSEKFQSVGVAGAIANLSFHANGPRVRRRKLDRDLISQLKFRSGIHGHAAFIQRTASAV